MLLVVADTSPLLYLVQIGEIDVLPQLFERVVIPVAVHEELCHASTPVTVRTWAHALPAWMVVSETALIDDPDLVAIDGGERAAIALGLSLGAGLVLMDDRRGMAVAVRKGLRVTGTLGVLGRAGSTWTGGSRGCVPASAADQFPL